MSTPTVEALAGCRRGQRAPRVTMTQEVVDIRSSRLLIAGSGAVSEQLQYSKEGAAIGGGDLGQ